MVYFCINQLMQYGECARINLCGIVEYFKVRTNPFSHRKHSLASVPWDWRGGVQSIINLFFPKLTNSSRPGDRRKNLDCLDYICPGQIFMTKHRASGPNNTNVLTHKVFTEMEDVFLKRLGFLFVVWLRAAPREFKCLLYTFLQWK